MFHNFYKLFDKLDEDFNAREQNLIYLKKQRPIFEKRRGPEARAQDFLLKNAIAIFKDEKRYIEYRVEYANYRILQFTEAALFGDNEVSPSEYRNIVQESTKLGVSEDRVKEYVEQVVAKKRGTITKEIDTSDRARDQVLKYIEAALFGDNEVLPVEFAQIIKEGMKLGLTETEIRRLVSKKVKKHGGTIVGETSSGSRQGQPSPNQNTKSHSSADNSQSGNNDSSSTGALTPVGRANVASAVAVSLAVFYVMVLKSGIYLGGWFGLLLFISAAGVSIKNANVAPKRHGWGVVAALIMYIVNYNTFLILIPVSAIWHWSPLIFSHYPSKEKLVWLLPVILCVGVYGSVEAVQRVPRSQANLPPRLVQPRSGTNQQQLSQITLAELLSAKQQRSTQPKTTQQRTTQIKTTQQRTTQPQTLVAQEFVRTQESIESLDKLSSEKLWDVWNSTKEEKIAKAKTRTKSGKPTYIYLELFATDGPQSTELDVSRGDTLVFDVSDETKIEWSESESPVGPEGTRYLAKTRPNGSNFLCADAACGSVVGRIGEKGNWFPIGSSAVMLAHANGVLYLSINDVKNGFDDNFGMFGVQVLNAERKH